MKLFPIFLLSVFLFLLGFVFGGYAALDSQSLISELLGKNKYDAAMFAATFVAALGTAVATTFAFYLYFRWKSQQNEIELMTIRKELLKTLILIEKEAIRLYVGYRFHAEPKSSRHHEEVLSSLLAEFRTNLYLLNSFGSEEMASIEDDNLVLEPCGNYLDSSKSMYKLCSELYSASIQKSITSEKVEGDILRKVAINEALDFDGSSKNYATLKEAISSESGFKKALSRKLASASKDLGKANSGSGI
ncbi:hypothetical protein BBM55_02850 [Vibrio parahaemolyticus]|uniref:hypothetical protein n=1 Tax=Vibrio parahaemolyticus TaxID=670 RepID=UPI00084B9D78|nr:hypothetical protein [Vibrio parahaemolyticus]ODX15941.1 hypothetical protein BBM00_21780 [Vibrio parahaemolyticus]OEA24478.1 hypothetical protein BBM55_02850 [Vibrio parahaemolyticus]